MIFFFKSYFSPQNSTDNLNYIGVFFQNGTGDLHIRLDTITTSDVMKAIDRTKPSAGKMKERYAAWQREYESV